MSLSQIHIRLHGANSTRRQLQYGVFQVKLVLQNRVTAVTPRAPRCVFSDGATYPRRLRHPLRCPAQPVAFLTRCNSDLRRHRTSINVVSLSARLVEQASYYRPIVASSILFSSSQFCCNTAATSSLLFTPSFLINTLR